MDTNRIKKFATEARTVLKTGVAAKLQTLGFKKDGSVAEEMMPRLFQGGCIWNSRTETEGFYHRWMSLYERVQRKGLNEVYEEVAYTWFNRFVAIRILRKNGLAEPVLDFVDSANTPRIVDQARSGQLPQMNEEDRRHLVELLDDDTKTTEQFALLMTAWCHNNPIISKCFGSIADYTEILLPNNILVEGGFIDMLNHTEFITDEDFASPELIGWLYQFYISERKDEVFAKKGKLEADEIPAATQIFTPNWIVKYMVQNTVGRIYLDNNPYDTALKANWKYLVNSEPTPQDSIYKYNELIDLKVADLACGSGHILNECFDLLYELYIHEGYTRSEAIENIFKHNLTGIDLDKRAQQLSMFSLLLKACQKDRGYADAHCMPHILTVPKAWDDEKNGSASRAISTFLQGNETGKMLLEINEAMKLMKDAESLGSIMKFNISDTTRLALAQAKEYWLKTSYLPNGVVTILPYINLLLALINKYSALVMNPPYMGSGNMNSNLSDYVKKYYEDSKADLCTVFMDLAIDSLEDNGKYAMINMQSWMFLSSFEKLRNKILSSQHLENLLHLGARFFDSNSVGTIVQNVAFVISKNRSETCKGNYYRLVEGKNCSDKETLYLHANKYSKIYYHNIDQNKFHLLPGCTIGYWIEQAWLDVFSHPTLKLRTISDGQTKTGDNNKYLRLLWEVSNTKVGPENKWVKHPKGGGYRKWYGNVDTIIDWSLNARLHYRKDKVARILPEYLWWRKGVCWNLISTEKKSFRLYNDDEIFNLAAPTIFFERESDIYYSLGLLNTPISDYIIQLLNPTLNCNIGDIQSIPFIISNKADIENLVEKNISISKQDWDAHETSWEFKENELIRLNQEYDTLKESFFKYTDIWTQHFFQLHTNEEELNRKFIKTYGLQEELTPDVPLNEVTILQDGEIKIENGEIRFQPDVVMKQLISYGIGCWMGRYRLDVPGLHIAHPNPTKDEICTYEYNDESLTIDDDGIIPLLPYDCPFDDNLQTRVADFIRIAFGADSLTENLNFIEQSLGCTIEKYLDKDYWKDHKKMYQNRPIYWLWSSKKGAFRVLTYMHRMDAYTAERVRSKYLLPYIEFLQNKISDLENRTTSLSTADSRKLDNYRKILEECREYHERLQVVAEQAIGFDLDDGVVVNYAKFGDVLSKIK